MRLREQKPRSTEFLDVLKSGAQLARRHHSIYQDWLRDLIGGAPGLQEKQRERMLFWTRQLINGLSPSNYFWTNFSAVKRFMDSNGESLAKGLQSWTGDLLEGHPLMRMVDSRAFKVGRDIATTPGAVVFRNDLMELIQYEPATETTYPVPVVFIQPWINKYYIFDLTAQMSFVRYMQQKGFTVFIVSWKNPDSPMRNVTFDDYMLRGALQAIRVASSICRNAPVHAAGYCIGGTALSALMAWLNSGPPSQRQSFPVADWTLFSSLVDFSEPGDIGFFVTQQSVEVIEAMMKAQGVPEREIHRAGVPPARFRQPDLAELHEQLPVWPIAAQVGSAVLEQRQHPPAGSDVLLLSARILSEQQARGKRRAEPRGPAHRPGPHHAAALCGRERRSTTSAPGRAPSRSATRSMDPSGMSFPAKDTSRAS